MKHINARAFAAFMFLGILATGTTQAQSFDSVSLQVDLGPEEGEVSLLWIGGQPLFRVYRSADPITVLDPGNILAELTAREWTDHPPEIQLYFYKVTSDCVYDPPEICDLVDNDCNGLIDEGCPPPANDTCAGPDTLQEGVARPGATITAVDDYDLSCLALDSGDVVHEFETTNESATLLSLTPSGSWEIAAALRADSDCSTNGVNDISCVSSGYASRYINRPNLPAGRYTVIVDGSDGAVGGYTIKYETGPVDSTYGYWIIEMLGTFVPLSGATSVTIPLSDWPVDPWPGDEWSVSLPLPFPFDYHGVSRSSVNISSDMYLTFETVPTGVETYINDCPLDGTAPNETIAPFWDDGLSNAAYPTQLLHATHGTAPNRRFVIEFRDWDLLSCSPSSCFLLPVQVNHQVILHEVGDIEFRYGPRQNSGMIVGCRGNEGGAGRNHHLGECATIGIEGHHSSGWVDVDSVDCQTDSAVSDGRVVYFVHPN